MKHRIIPPPEHLKDYVRYFWTLESDNSAETPKTFKAIADGSPGMIFQHSDEGSFYQFDKKLAPVFLYGQTTVCTEISSPAAFSTIGVYFAPHVLKSVFGLKASELTDSCIDIGEIAGKQGFPLEDRLLEAKNFEEKSIILSEYLSLQLKQHKAQEDSLLTHIIDRINRCNGVISVKDLQTLSGLSERSFERRFQQSIGVSPKLYSRICRFQASLKQLRENDFQKLSDIAFENEYSDQSHFIRAFKEFAGFSPKEFQKRSNEQVANFPEIQNKR
ncbi:MAG: AraC family transcriptional regulator [Citrobacter freundii]|nr:MAG: AraC family transcriptional regulator [Citrobacter freundii]